MITTFNIKINNIQIENVKHYKLLCIIIDYNLNLNLHTNTKILKITMIVYLISNMSKYLEQ